VLRRRHPSGLTRAAADGDLPGSRRWLTVTAAALFLIYAINFLCFFVDDEAITFVYAQHLLRGHGLVYSAVEGPTEGYSDFLHVGVAAGLLAFVSAVGLPKIAVFGLGKALSLASGVTVPAVVASGLKRFVPETAVHPGALVLLALSGPVALWSCSSLETIPFVLLFTAFVVSLLIASAGGATAAGVFGAMTMLMRVDGFVYVGVAWLAASSSRHPDSGGGCCVM
jgi:hypothetical protein